MGGSTILFRVLCYLAAGGFVALAAIPSGEVSRGFFRFTAALYAGLIALGAGLGYGGAADPYALGAFGLAAALGLAAAGLSPVLGARAARSLLAGAALLGVLACARDGLLTALALGARTGVPPALGTATAAASALLLGSVMTAMILGHWYLVMPALPPDPLMRLTRVYALSVLGRGVGVALVLGLLHLAGGRALDRFLGGAGLILWPRLLFGLVAPAVLALMALPTVRVRDTQPATGMLYVASVLVLVGEGMAHWLGLRTGVPI